MYHDQDEVCALEKGLERAKSELGSQTVSVLVVEDACLEIAYPGNPRNPGCWPASVIDWEDPVRFVRADTPAAVFLTSAVAPVAKSFVLFPWRAQRRAVIIVFGFADREPAYESIPAHLEQELNLAALATWSLKEVDCLRAELRTVNDRFAQRKLVERAKCVLQAERGMDEQQAYEHLRKLSRQRRIPMSKLAEGLLASPRS
jgi:hypothetical protein